MGWDEVKDEKEGYVRVRKGNDRGSLVGHMRDANDDPNAKGYIELNKEDLGGMGDGGSAPHSHPEYVGKTHAHDDKADTTHTHNNYADKTHDHPPQDLTHNHNGVYQPAGTYADKTHAHPEKADKTHTHDTTHNHDANYAPVHDHPYASDGHDHDAAYKHDHPYAKDDHTHDTSHSHGNYFLKGGGTDDDGNSLPLPYGDAFTLGEAVDGVKDENSEQNGRLDAVEAHGHPDLATKEDVAALEAEMELLAKTLEFGVWQVTDSSIRPGKVNLTSNDFSAVDNILNIHNEDTNGKTHGWTALDAGSYIELTQGSSSDGRSLADADYALYEVTSVMTTDDWVSITVKLYQGNGDGVNDEFFRIKVIDLAGTDINDLDSRYAKTNHTHDDKVHPGRPFRFTPGLNADGGFQTLDGGARITFAVKDLNGLSRVQNSYPDFSWDEHCKITVWHRDSGVLKFALKAGKTTDYSAGHISFKGGAKLYDKGLVTGEVYDIVVEGYW